jgi:LacI family transcriptional regulator
VEDKLVFQAGRTMEDGARAAKQMLSENSDATAVQAVNDLVAAGCAEAFLNEGLKIPEHISITGFGNTMLSEYFRIPLTTANQPKHRLGVAAMESMLQLLNGQRPAPKRLPAPLIIRASSGTPPATPPLKRLKTLNV